LGNLTAQFGRPWLVLWPSDPPAAQVEQFFHHGASLGLLLGGLVVTLGAWRARDDPPADAVRRLAWFAVAALALWSVVVFTAGGALIHHGSPATTTLLFFAGGYGLTRLA
jgi:hypothetical protein